MAEKTGVVIAPAGKAGPPAQAKSPLHISSAKFSPGVGAPGSPNYVRPKLTLIVRSAAATSISKVEAEVWSEPFTNSEVVTSSNSKNSAIRIFKGIWQVAGGSYSIPADKDVNLSFVLRRTSKDEVDTQETGPGVYSPADWGHAFAQTTMATFAWRISSPAGNVSGTYKKSPKQAWVWP